MKAMILAAGLGTRLKPYTEHTPKPLFTINRRPVLDMTIEKCHQAGCTEIIINTHHHHEQLDAFVTQQAYPVPVHLRYEPVILGTGGGIRNVADLWAGDDLLVINGDVICDLDFARIYAHHQRHGAAVTMVMHHHPAFNSVWVDSRGWVVGFDPTAPTTDPATSGSCRQLAFTGIHVLTQRVLDYLPSEGPAHIITAYSRMLTGNERIKAHIVQDHYWQDIGTPARYQAAAFDSMAPKAFERAFGTPAHQPLERQPLKGDGSDRQWYRVISGSRHLIMVDHGICRQPDIRQEVHAFMDIGRHLSRQKAAVPKIHMGDPMSGLVWVEDLGDLHLQQTVHNASDSERLHLYRQVIDAWQHMAIAGGRGFDTGWTYQSTHYDQALILEKECRYFVEAFLQGYLGWSTPFGELAGEFESLADAAINNAAVAFMHRDLQSRNIMVKDGRIFFIDFQGGRMGPMQYDLASLLIDPYVALTPELQHQLLNYTAQTLERRYGIDGHRFLEGYAYCVLTRNLQMLGAFAHLSRVKHKAQFEAYIAPAVYMFTRHLAALKKTKLPKLQRVAVKAAEVMN